MGLFNRKSNSNYSMPSKAQKDALYSLFSQAGYAVKEPLKQTGSADRPIHTVRFGSDNTYADVTAAFCTNEKTASEEFARACVALDKIGFKLEKSEGAMLGKLSSDSDYRCMVTILDKGLTIISALTGPRREQ